MERQVCSTPTELHWYQYDTFRIAFTDSVNSIIQPDVPYVALIQVCDTTKFWACDMQKYLDVLNDRGVSGLVLFDIRATPRYTAVDADFVQVFLKYRQFWMKDLAEMGIEDAGVYTMFFD